MASETQNLSSLSPMYAHLLFCRGSRWRMPISAGPLSALYICRETSTNQLLFMQNKPNFRKSQMNVSIFSKMAYEYKSNWTLGENKPNSNPIKPNLQKAQINVNSLITKDYRKNDAFAVKKTNPIQTQFKPNQSQFQKPFVMGLVIREIYYQYTPYPSVALKKSM